MHHRRSRLASLPALPRAHAHAREHFEPWLATSLENRCPRRGSSSCSSNSLVRLYIVCVVLAVEQFLVPFCPLEDDVSVSPFIEGSARRCLPHLLISSDVCMSQPGWNHAGHMAPDQLLHNCQLCASICTPDFQAVARHRLRLRLQRVRWASMLDRIYSSRTRLQSVVLALLSVHLFGSLLSLKSRWQPSMRCSHLLRTLQVRACSTRSWRLRVRWRCVGGVDGRSGGEKGLSIGKVARRGAKRPSHPLYLNHDGRPRIVPAF